MAVSDPVADMLTKIRNAANARFASVDVYKSNLKLSIAKIFQAEGYVESVDVVSDKNREFIRLGLKYDEAKRPIIHGIKRISTPGRRVYANSKDLPRVFNGFGTLVVSTSNGVITGKKAKESKLGGELVCSIW